MQAKKVAGEKELQKKVCFEFTFKHGVVTHGFELRQRTRRGGCIDFLENALVSTTHMLHDYSQFHPQTISPLPPCLTVDWTQFSRNYFPIVFKQERALPGSLSILQKNYDVSCSSKISTRHQGRVGMRWCTTRLMHVTKVNRRHFQAFAVQKSGVM